ncbi:GPI anchored protein [Aspergillus steynii IBT 23096]|uniref:GPI anchored protein n=1 Tax=Aspergillus steynii IBT 23096 TaxID=1392250 RepID=A0A2I2G8P8_9EURO|nr:GPI anchored protein [Aspergillus steynii IBT 23096]PLB49256.1 GPI anchored protein [Aspergillus steynii IBT 23096]
MQLSLLTFASLAPLVAAHFKLNYPESRGVNEDKMTQFPCGGLSASSDRTKVALSNDGSAYLPVAITLGHSQTAVEVLLSLGDDPGENYNVTLVPTFRIEGLGSFCIPDITFDKNTTGLNLTDGVNATVQVQSNGDPTGGLYACADIQFSTSIKQDQPDSCKNNTGVSAKLFHGDAAKRNANESTADGEAQSGGSSASASSTGSSPSSTGAAVALETATWGVLGAAVVGAMAVL